MEHTGDGDAICNAWQQHHKPVEHDSVNCNTLISALEEAKKWKGSLGLLQEMVHRLLTLNVVADTGYGELECGHKCI